MCFVCYSTLSDSTVKHTPHLNSTPAFLEQSQLHPLTSPASSWTCKLNAEGVTLFVIFARPNIRRLVTQMLLRLVGAPCLALNGDGFRPRQHPWWKLVGTIFAASHSHADGLFALLYSSV